MRKKLIIAKYPPPFRKARGALRCVVRRAALVCHLFEGGTATEAVSMCGAKNNHFALNVTPIARVAQFTIYI